MSKAIFRPLRIAMICDPISDYTAGVFVSTWRFARLLKERGHTIIFVAASSPEHKESGEDRGFMMYRFPSVLLPKTEGAWRIAIPRRKQLCEIFEKEHIDIVHLIVPMPSAIIAAQAARSLNIPVIAHSHAQPENAFMHLPIRFLRPPLNAGFDAYMGRIYRAADSLIFPSEFAQECLKKYTQDKTQCVISNGVDTSVFVPSAVKDSACRSAHHATGTSYVVLYVGRLHPEKNVETLIRAFAGVRSQNPNALLWIVGGGHLEEMLRALAIECGVADAVYFLGKISDEDLILAYQAADVFVLPSLAELEGMVVLEAMSSGLPIVIANAPQSASRFFVHDDNGFLFEPMNSEALANILVRLGDAELRTRMSTCSRLHAQDFDIHKSVQKIEEVYYAAAHL